MASILSRRRSPDAHAFAFANLVREAELSRRLAIYDRETSWLSPWYMQLRISEECARARRYLRPLSLLSIEAQGDGAAQLSAWLTSHLRSTDLASRGRDGRWLLLLPETDCAGAYRLAKRIGAEVTLAAVAIAAYPEEEDRFHALMASLEQAWPRVA